MTRKQQREAREFAESITPQAVAALSASYAKDSLAHFVKLAWPHVEPETKLAWNWHIDVLCDVLEEVTAGSLQRVIINIPPGCMKSLLVSVFWPAWEWARRPSLRYLTASYGSHLSVRDNLRLRAVVSSEWFQRYYALRLASDQNAKERFDTTERGWRIATSVGGVGTGEHPDRIIIDDPLTAEQARSDAERERANYWFDRTIASRGVAREVRTVVIMQRLHEDDLAGHLLARGGWEHVMLPMRYDPNRADKRDARTEPGELLWPSLFSEDKLRALELALDPYGVASQMQQQPAPEGKGLFQRAWFPIVDVVPNNATRCRGWDTAATEGGGDWTAGVKLAIDENGIIYIEDVQHEQMGPASVDSLIKAMASLDGDECLIREEKEGGSAGKSVITARVRGLAGYDYAGVSITGNKVTRARPFRAQAEAGNVRLLRGPWNEKYLRELEVFPVGKHDDQVDATSCAYNALVEIIDENMSSVTWGGRV